MNILDPLLCLSLSLSLSLSPPPFSHTHIHTHSHALTPSSGSAEGFSLAEKAISSASKAGRWVLLKNVHLAPQWLVQLEKKFHSLTPHSHFRLFLTMEINPKVFVCVFVCMFVYVHECVCVCVCVCVR